MMKKIFLLMIISLFSSLCIFPQEKEISAQTSSQNEIISFSISENIGLLNGSIKEYVYWFGECLNDDGLLSRLDWDVKNIFYLEQKIRFDIAKYLYLGLDVFSAFSKKSGNMQDYDWLNYQHWPDDNPTELTNYSIHDNYLSDFTKINFFLGMNFFIIPQTVLSACVGFEYSSISFDGTDGYRTYKAENWIPYAFEGKVISYKQIFHTPFIGLSLRTRIIPRFLINTDIAISPFLTTIDAYDYHWVRNIVFWDNIINSFALKISTGVSYNFAKHHNIGLTASINYTPISIGTDYSNSLDSEGNIKSDNDWIGQSCHGGSSNFLWSIALAYTFTIF